MITAVFYDPSTGDIIASTQAPLASLQADPRAWLEVPVYQMSYDQTHRVVDGVLTPKGE
jgi:hypothetical protein